MSKNKRKNTAAPTLPAAVTPPAELVPVIESPQRDGFDVARWRMSIKQAEDPQMAERNLMYDIYNDIMLDTHLTSGHFLFLGI